MAWWRRDPSLWSRTPIHRYARRDAEATLRSRCFSKSKPTSARHNDEPDNTDNVGKKPEGMSKLEWMQQQHYKRWKRRIEENPYTALFGASENMLRGRGLIRADPEGDWKRGLEWVERTFPRWMVQEMGLGDKDKDKGVKNEKDGGGYPKKVKIDGTEESAAKEREGMFPEPSFRTGRFERDLWNSGVESPSDSRRPREQPIAPSSDQPESHRAFQEKIRRVKEAGVKEQYNPDEPAIQKNYPVEEQKVGREVSSNATSVRKNATQSSKEATARETSFIEEFLADTPHVVPPAVPGHQDNKDWRQTAMERRASPTFALKPRRQTDVPVIDVTAKANVGPEKTDIAEGEGKSGINTILSASGEESLRKVDAVHEPDAKIKEEAEQAPSPRIRTDDWLLAPSDSVKPDQKEHKKEQSNPRRLASDILDQLPKDDLDLLSADEIRASMGRTRRAYEDKNAVRQKLEEDFNNAQKETLELDPLIEAKVVNDQYVRRKKSELFQLQEQTETAPDGASSAKLPVGNEPVAAVPEQRSNDETAKSPPVSVLETGLDFMSRWLHNGGNILAQHFWQDPVQVVAGQNPGADEEFLKGIGIGVLKGRRAFASIKDELVADIPASSQLVSRLNRDQIKASAGAVRMYRDLPSALKDTSDAAASKAAAYVRIGKLRQALLDTDKQFKEACELVDNMKSTTKPSLLLQKRLRLAADILRKNAQLTRMAVFGLQARIEVDVGASGGLIARELLHRLLALQDTQLALSRLVSRTMQVLGVDAKAEEEVATKIDETEIAAVDLADPTVIEALASVAGKNSSAKQEVDTTAANAKLEEEVNKQKAAMRGLSDDGYARSPKPFVRKPFDEPSPLAHSLFRPFGLQLESLGKDVDTAKEGVIDAAKKAKGDRELVKEVRKAYEDVYGPINVDHWQVPPNDKPHDAIEELTKVPELKAAMPKASIQMLKEDEISPSVTGQILTTEASPVSTLKDDVATSEAVLEAETIPEQSGPFDIPEHLRLQGVVGVDNDGKYIYQDVPRQHEPPAPTTSTETACHEENDSIAPGEDTVLTEQVNAERASGDALSGEAVPISYKTLIYNPETDKLSVTTSQIPQPDEPFDPIPLHEALTKLSHPAKFVDHLPEAFHVIAARPDVLTIRTASSNSTDPETNITSVFGKSDAQQKVDMENVEPWRGINPVDGTTTLSPTGFVGVGSDLETDLDFAERRKKAEDFTVKRKSLEDFVKETDKRNRKSRGGVGGVAKTAIWAGALCYVTGVVAELLK
ncbi:hypothetical protein N0V90_009667 [Kalmusia sp. IMI 367209]|nr:hypothetical protein N0V90_009667 [Kalmusia sp. IMI 367209]